MDANQTSEYLPAKTIDDVLAQLDHIIDQTVAEDNFLCVFAYVYRKTTAAIKQAILDGQFENPGRMEKLDVVFANYYIKAYYDYRLEKPVSESWFFAFELKNSSQTLVQHILLGMNAHINLDLSVAAASISQPDTILDLKHDFMVINTILATLTNRMQKGLGKSSIFMKLLDFFGFRSDEKVINFSIKKARDFAWLNAVELSLMDEKGKSTRIKEIDIRVAEISKIIKDPPGKILDLVLRFIGLFEVKNKQKIVTALKKS